MSRRFKSIMDELPQFYVLLLGLALVASIWFCNRRFGAEMACSVSYVLPISLVAWYVGGPWAVIMPVLAAMAALHADLSSRDIFRPQYNPYWTAVAGCICYLFISHLLVLCRLRVSGSERGYPESEAN